MRPPAVNKNKNSVLRSRTPRMAWNVRHNVCREVLRTNVARRARILDKLREGFSTIRHGEFHAT
jgi:hypothetical protein